MGEFIHGWRRKFGVVTLAIACLFAGGWVRSLGRKDEVSIRRNAAVTHHLISNQSRLVWKTITLDDPTSTNFLITFYFSDKAKNLEDYWAANAIWTWRHRWGGFEFGRLRPMGPPWNEDIWTAPYWSIVLPLTAISAWLIFWKPRTIKTGAKL